MGTDEVLLYTRKMMLEKHGFTIAIADPKEVIDRLNSSPFDVVVACHTLRQDEADTLVDAARARPSAPVLIGFSRQMSPEPSRHPFDATVWSLSSPETFLDTVHQALVHR